MVSFGPWFLAGGVAPFCPKAGLSASRKVVSSVILPRVESPAHSLSLGTPSGGFWVGTLSRLAANPSVWSGAFHSTGESAEEVPVAAEMGLDGGLQSCALACGPTTAPSQVACAGSALTSH